MWQPVRFARERWPRPRLPNLAPLRQPASAQARARVAAVYAAQMEAQLQAVLTFWFDEAGPSKWYAKDAAFDALIVQRFAEAHRQAAACESWAWRATPHGRLAEIIVLDQFSRNMFRDQPRAFATDALALALAQEAVRAGADRELPPVQRAFLLLPFMHSVSLAIHAEAVTHFDQPGLEQNLAFQHRHTDVLRRFGRYPGRNAALGRTSTAEELEALATPGAAF